MEKFNSKEQQAYDKGLGTGYRLGFQMGQIETCNRMMGQPKTLMERQIDSILEDKDITDNMRDYWKHLSTD